MVALSACGPHQDTAEEPSDPVAVEKVPGTDLARLVVEPEAVSRLGISTADVAAGTGASGTRIPAAALLYGPDGEPFVYVRSEENTFDRHPVTVDRVDGEQAM